jgi:hypothetical protein
VVIDAAADVRAVLTPFHLTSKFHKWQRFSRHSMKEPAHWVKIHRRAEAVMI